jgi:glycosyltransferase involved in cell wall biosynthesis
MQKILYLIDRYYPNDDAFIEEVQTKILPSKGYNVTIVARTKKYTTITKLKWNGSNVILIPSYIKYLSELAHIKYLRRLVKENWNIVHVRNDPIFSLLCLDLNFIFQLTHLKAEEFISDKKSIFSAFKGCLDLILRPLIFSKAYLIISMSKTMTHYIKAKYGAKRVSDLPMGVTEISLNEKRSKLIRHKYNLSGKVVFIYLGTMIRTRQLDVILHAYKRIENPNTALIMLGDAPDKNDVKWLKRIARQLQIQSVVFINRVPRNDVPDYIGAADIGLAVTPLTIANLCMSPTKTLEYLNCETPVLATDIPDQADIINNSGSGLICRFDVNDIADKMEEMVKKSQSLKNMGASGKQYVSENRDYHSISQKLISYYNETMKAGNKLRT